MLNRRGFLRYAAAASAGVVCVGCGIRHAIAQPASAPGRREITVGGRRVKTVDVLEHGMNRLGLVGAAIGGSVEGEEIAAPKFDPFWKKAEELQALVFIHPQTAPQSTGITKRIQGSGALGNVIGNPLETSLALAHLIFEGTLDRFPRVKVCGAHGGGFLPSY